MAAGQNPSYFQSVPFTQQIDPKEFLFHFYMFQHNQGTHDENEHIVVNPHLSHRRGTIIVHDWEIRDGPSIDAKIVARAQGVHIAPTVAYEDWHLSLSIVFTEERFKESTLKAIGTWTGAWAIVGGTGEFAFAQGIVEHNDTAIKNSSSGWVKELRIRVVCLPFQISVQTPVTKIGPWGGNGGTEFDIPAELAPQRLESVTISCGVAIDSIAFSYVGITGKKQSVGPWGGDGELTDTIQFAPLEIVKEILGTTGTFNGDNVVTSLTFVTNVRTYGPFGQIKGTAFSVPLMDTNVVGFFVRAGELVHALGVYAGPSIPN